MITEIPIDTWSVSQAVLRGDRDQLARFWLATPVDLLENLWSGPCGQASIGLIRQLNVDANFSEEQKQLRNKLNEQLQQGLDKPCAIQILLSVFLYSPPGQLKIESPERWLPNWLLPHYMDLYQSEHNQQLTNQTSTSVSDLPTPDFGPFPKTLQELLTNRIQLNRMLGLSNLYYIDPEDQEICQELLVLRRQFATAVNLCSEMDLEKLWQTELADRYWAMVRSGIQNEPMSEDDQQLKQQAVIRLQPSKGGGFGTPGALNAFIVSMLFYVPGTMQVEGAEQKVPSWLLTGYQEVFASSLTA